MATGTILLPIGAATPGDGTTNNVPAKIQRAKSSATAPSPFWLEALFDGSTKNWLTWAFRMPQDYASGPVLKIIYKATSATTGTIVFEGRLAAYTPGTDTTDFDAKAYGSANTTGANTVPATTAGKLAEVSLTLTNADSVAAGDMVVLTLARAPADANDTVTSGIEVTAVALEYTTA